MKGCLRTSQCTGAVPRALSEQINLSLHISHENFVTENEIFCSNYTMDNWAFGPGAFDILALPKRGEVGLTHAKIFGGFDKEFKSQPKVTMSPHKCYVYPPPPLDKIKHVYERVTIHPQIPKKLFCSLKICQFTLILFLVACCIFALFAPKPPVCQNLTFLEGGVGWVG